MGLVGRVPGLTRKAVALVVVLAVPATFYALGRRPSTVHRFSSLRGWYSIVVSELRIRNMALMSAPGAFVSG